MRATSNINILSKRYQCVKRAIRKYAVVSPKKSENQEKILISCKHPKFNFYSNDSTGKFDKIEIASKGWTHSKSKGDYFIVHPQIPVVNEDDITPFHNITNSMLSDCLARENVFNATSFQKEAIVSIRTGNNILLSGETGCGKTIAYLLPVIEKIIGNSSNNMNEPKVLILVPNRELAYQIGRVAEKLCDTVDLKVKTIVGGRTKKLIINPEFSPVDILVGTPGVISKLSTLKVIKLDKVQHTVVDEADTLLDDSFEDKIKIILNRTIQSQLILVSATIPKKIPDYLAPIEPSLNQVISPKVHKPLLNIMQRFLRLNKMSKPAELLQVAKKTKKPMIIFSNRNATCNWVALFLRENGINCSNINGEMNYAIRIQQWNQFVSGDNLILSATDIGSRGLNTVQVTHVLNYDFPLYASDYIHRIGRTGRFGSPSNCLVTNFIAGYSEVKLVQDIETAIRTNTPIPNVDGNITSIVQRKIMQQIR